MINPFKRFIEGLKLWKEHRYLWKDSQIVKVTRTHSLVISKDQVKRLKK